MLAEADGEGVVALEAVEDEVGEAKVVVGADVDATEVVLGDKVLVMTVLAADAVTQTVLKTVLVWGVTEEEDVTRGVGAGRVVVGGIVEGVGESVATGSSTAGAAAEAEGSVSTREGVG